MQPTLTNPRAARQPFRRYLDAGQTIETLHYLGKTAIGRIHNPTGLPIVAYVGRWRNRHCQHVTLAGCFAILKRYRAEQKADENAQISYLEAINQLFVPIACIRLFCASNGFKTNCYYSRREIRRRILANRGLKTPWHLALLRSIVIEKHLTP